MAIVIIFQPLDKATVKPLQQNLCDSVATNEGSSASELPLLHPPGHLGWCSQGLCPVGLACASNSQADRARGEGGNQR